MIATRSSVTEVADAGAAAPDVSRPGVSHRSIRSVTMKKITLTRMTKQIAA